jgi:SAM-dependent methyltransferase
MTLRGIFDEAAELYDRVRPHYPEAVFSDLSRLAGLRAGCRVLELGCGTGQATVPLARRGYAVTAIELGPRLAALAAGKLASFPSACVVNAAFEEWSLPAEPYDLVVAATAFHWLDPAVRLVKSARALRAGGALAVISTHHIAGGDERFFAEVQRCYERWMPGTPSGLRLPAAAEVPAGTDALVAGGHFTGAGSRRYEWDATYSTGEYCELIESYSDDGFDGRVTKRSMTELAVARTPAT